MMNIFVSGAVTYYLSITNFIVLRGAFFLTVKYRKERLYDGIRLLSCFFYPRLDFRSRWEEKSFSFRRFFPSPVCMLRPNLFICSKQISIPSITSLLAEQIEAPSSTYKNKNNSSLVRNLYLLL